MRDKERERIEGIILFCQVTYPIVVAITIVAILYGLISGDIKFE